MDADLAERPRHLDAAHPARSRCGRRGDRPQEVPVRTAGRGLPSCDIIVANAWRPRLSLAESYGTGRVWLAGDSAHQVVPAGGYGMNTGVGDAVGLGWVLAAIHQGWGDRRLLDTDPSAGRSQYATGRLLLGTLWCGWRSKPCTARRFTVRAGTANAAAGAWAGRSLIWAISKTRLTESNSDIATTPRRSCAANRTPHQLITWTRTRPVRCPGPDRQPLPGRRTGDLRLVRSRLYATAVQRHRRGRLRRRSSRMRDAAEDRRRPRPSRPRALPA